MLSRHFNPRSDERSDGCSCASALPCLSFQSTLRRTERLAVLSEYLQNTNFNPRSDERSDTATGYVEVYLHISIHAPTNGATSTVALKPNTSLFQSTLRRTERQPFFNSSLKVSRISIHAPTNGATFMVILKRLPMNIFQSTLRRTERHLFRTN